MDIDRVHNLRNQALQAEHRGRFDEARDLLRQVTTEGQMPQSLDARLRLGKLLISGGPPCRPEAEDVLTAASHQAEQAGSTRMSAGAIHLLALLERYRGQPDRAEQILDESPVAAQAAVPSPARAQWLHYHGLIEADRGDLNNAQRFLYRAYKVYQESHDDLGAAEVCDSLANLLLRQGKAAYALIFARQSLELKQRLDDLYGEAISHGTTGRAFLLQARYAEAAEEFQRDLEITRELGDVKGIGIMLNSLGEVALLRRDLNAAAAYLREALEVEAGPAYAAHAHLGLARVLLADGKTDEADRECDQAQALLEANPDLVGLPDLLRGLQGAIGWRRGDHAGGEQQLTAAIDALEAGNYR
jgi:tetratricopeptide (TPR) repeat protein